MRAVMIRVPFLIRLALLASLVVTARAGDTLPACPAAADASSVVLAAPSSWRAAGQSGANANFVRQDDVFWADATARQSLSRLAPASLRFPGGEEADNYDWQRHALDRPGGWPGEPADAAGRADRTDFREFLQHAADLGVASVFLEVNVDTAVRGGLDGDADAALQAGAARAAAWVREVAKMRPPMKVFWEIGNEPDVGSGYPVTVAEYVRVLRAYAAAMRAADPGVQLGAAGPLEAGASGYADLLTPEQLAWVRSRPGRGEGACRARIADCVAQVRARLPGEAQRVRWWPVVAGEAGDAFDFIVVHRYDHTRFDDDSEPGVLVFSAALDRLRQFVGQRRGGPVAVAVTEWNTPNAQRRGALGEQAHIPDFAVQSGNLVLAAEYSHTWPLGVGNRSYRQLIATDGGLTAGGRVREFYADVQPGDRVAHVAPGKRLYAFLYRRPQQLGYVLVNARQQAVALALPGEGRTARVSTLVDGEARAACAAVRKGDHWRVVLSPGSVARVQVDLAP